MMYQLSTRQKTIILGSVMLGMFVSALDQTVVSTAMPRIIAELGGLSRYSWVFTSYMLTSTALTPIVGKLGDMYGRKQFFISGIALFMLASILSGASQNIEQLIAFRALQGVGAGFIMANSFTIIGDMFPPAERGKFTGLFSGTFGLASITGPFIGGFLTDHLSWRWTFYVNIPVGLIALPALYFGLPKPVRSGIKRRIDYWGAITLTAATVPLLLAAVWVGERRYSLTAPVTVLTAGFAVLMVAGFIWSERRAAEPILPLSLFKNRTYTVGTIIGFMSGLAMFGVISFVPLFVQGALGRSATRSGSVTMPQMIAMVITSVIGGQLVSRTGRYKVQTILGTVCIMAGIGLLTQLTVTSQGWEVSRNLILVGIGMGMTMPTLGVAMQNAVPQHMLGVVSSSSQFFRQIGGTLGVAILGAMLTSHLSGEIAATLPADVTARATPELLALARDAQTMLNPAQLAKLRAGFTALGPDGAQLFISALDAMRLALAHSLSRVFTFGAALLTVALASSFFLPEVPLRRTLDGPVPTRPTNAESGPEPVRRGRPEVPGPAGD